MMKPDQSVKTALTDRFAGRVIAGFIALISISVAGLTGCGAARSGPPSGGPYLAGGFVPDPVPYRVYLPPDWDGRTPLPLIVFLHDRGGRCTDLQTSGVISMMSAMMKTGEMPPFILAAPESDQGYWVNYHDGTCRYADFLCGEFIPAMRTKYPVIAGPAGEHLLGVGTGAMGAVALGAAYPGRFGTVGAVEGQYFDTLGASVYIGRHAFSGLRQIMGPPDNPDAMKVHSIYDRITSRAGVRGTRFILGSGAYADWETTESNEVFRQHLAQLGISNDFVTYHGVSDRNGRLAVVPIFVGLQLGDKRNQGDFLGMPYEVIMFR
ncbi:hypothetical protein JXA80_10515 [bacterium]|nr:hypothetical protein [candidate division CSSED10-310 bacterium]